MNKQKIRKVVAERSDYQQDKQTVSYWYSCVFVSQLGGRCASPEISVSCELISHVYVQDKQETHLLII